MISGLGIDIVEIARIRRALARFGARFLDKILTEDEQRDVSTNGIPSVPGVAARFAAKEAAVKALGTGFSQGIGPLHVEVRRLPSGQPEMVLHGPARARCQQIGAVRCHLSLTHGRETAAAVVVLETL